MTQDMIILEFDRIIEQLKTHAVSATARRLLQETEPILNESRCKARMEETTAARKVMEQAGTPPLAETDGTEAALIQATQGSMLTPELLCRVARFVATLQRMGRYLRQAEIYSPGIASWRTELPEISHLVQEIERCVNDNAVLEDASPALKNLKRHRELIEQNIREKLAKVLSAHKSILADQYITQRSGSYVVPVQKRYQSSFPGHVVDVSAKGSTVFMEPAAIRTLRQEMDDLTIEIDAEERRILWELSNLVASEETSLTKAVDVMTELDIIFARAKLSFEMNAVPVELTTERRICLKNARHPLLDSSLCVPLDLELSSPDTGIAITGPNTGGKTVCLKTVGLLTLMAQIGLHLPCGKGTVISMADRVLCDIGDSQSISQNLSTFSGHMTNMIRILKECSRDSLVLLDEPGSGTDPAEGSGIAAAILEELLRRKCFFMVTTHDPQIKQWSEQTGHVVCGRMAFDHDSLQPLYRLELGLSGESCAIEIARRLGLNENLLTRARQIADHGTGVPPVSQKKPMPAAVSTLQRIQPKTRGDFNRFVMGDSVMLLPDQKTAIVYQPADDDGNVIIHIQGEKLKVRHNRLKLLVPAEQLYPDDYDFSIVFDTVANRKAAHTMSRKFDPDAVIVLKEGQSDH